MLHRMKKWIAILVVIVLLFFIAISLLIPSQFSVSNTILLKANPNSVYRCLMNEGKWEKILGENVSNNNFKQRKEMFKVKRKLMESLEVQIKEKGSFFPSLIKILPLNNDSSGIKWAIDIKNGPNPFKKIKNFFIARNLEAATADILDSMKKFLENEENIYGINVHIAGVKDTLLITVKATFKNYPTLQNIYSLISMLQNYTTANGAKQTGYPMLNVRTKDSINFETMAGLPVSKSLKDSGMILRKEIPSVGRMLATSEIKGGPYTIAKAFNNLEDFFEDYKFISPAIPFQSIITNRMQERDTTKWTTVIYYPIY
jgi:hypothetical protein